MHGWQLVAACGIFGSMPGLPHTVQLTVVMPIFPAGHSAQGSPPTLARPGAHVSQYTPSRDTMVPSGQRRHLGDCAKCTGTCVPGKMELHCSNGTHSTPSAENLPAAHESHVLRLALGARPGAHVTHASPSSDARPGGQASQSDAIAFG